jgi:uncharacterized membrane protein YciS (DUF1049 family)
MSDMNDFKKLWEQQPATAIPDASELFEKANRLKKKTKMTLWKANILLLGTAVFIALIIFNFHPEMITTKLGALLVIIGIVVYLAVYNRSISGLSAGNVQKSTKEYLQELIQLKQKQEFLHKTMLSVYFIFLTTGIVLYMIEYTMRMTLLAAMITYGATLAWIGFGWFYLRPRTAKKQLGEINELIEKLENVNRQLGAE